MALKQRQDGQLLHADAFDHLKGLNITDSPFKLTDEHTPLGYNYDYTVTGGIKKRAGHTLLNATPDVMLTTMGMFMYQDSQNSKTLLRAAGISLEDINLANGTSTPILSDATGATSSIFTDTTNVVFSQFNTPAIDTSWLAGGGQSTLGGYTGSVYTLNGAIPPTTGILTFSQTTTGGSLPSGGYYYAIEFQKASTGAFSNAGADTFVSLNSALTLNSTGTITVHFGGVTNPDPTVYTNVVIYRSAPNLPTEPDEAFAGFTAGNLVATVPWTSGSFTDLGNNQVGADLIPRAGSINVDNSMLPDGDYEVVTTWKRRLVTASGNTLYFSDINKPESWPLANTLNVPTGGKITGLAVINFSTPTSATIDEMLCVFQERQLWMVTGNNFTLITDTSGNVVQTIDIVLLLVDFVGCPSQSLITIANGFIYWIDYRGVFIWDGSYKPVYASRPIEYDWSLDGDVDLSNLTKGWCTFYRRNNQVIWVIPSKSLGGNKLVLKLDLRLSLPNMTNALAGRMLEGVFIKDTLPFDLYGVNSVINEAQELVFAGGSDGNIWEMYQNQTGDGQIPIPFQYRTRPEDYGLTGTTKRYNKLIVWASKTSLNKLTVRYWTDYNVQENNYKQLIKLPISSQIASPVLWDISLWDVASWDAQNPNTFNFIVFNLNNVEGDALTLEFDQSDLSTPFTIAGYTVLYSQAGTRK